MSDANDQDVPVQPNILINSV